MQLRPSAWRPAHGRMAGSRSGIFWRGVVMCGDVQGLGYAWPISFSLSQAGQDPVMYYSYALVTGTMASPGAEPYVLPVQVPMMILRDPPGEGRHVDRSCQCMGSCMHAWPTDCASADPGAARDIASWRTSMGGAHREVIRLWLT